MGKPTVYIMKYKIYHTVKAVSYSNRTIVETYSVWRKVSHQNGRQK